MTERDDGRQAGWIGRAVGERLSYANVMSTIAVFGVLAGGGAYAASQIGAADIANNAVRSKHIKTNAVKASEIKNGAVASAKLAVNSVNSAKAQDDSLIGADIDESTLGQVPSAADAAQLGGEDAASFLGRGVGSPTSAVGMNWYSYFGNTGGTTDYVFGQMKLQTTGTAGQFRICGNGASGATFNWVRYVNGVRSAGTVGGTACTTAFDVGAGGDFQVQMRRSIVFGVHSGDSTTNENYNLYGFGQL